ncbi:excalibur calcium-binding domain-containing protein [Brucella intermedia]|nr:excalibur calcium-binding domain-containing protein [Brucella intermedia]
MRQAAARSCKAAGSCKEAVIMWCSGYRGADRDGDGIPCENVCSSLGQVNAIRAEIGCE